MSCCQNGLISGSHARDVAIQAKDMGVTRVLLTVLLTVASTSLDLGLQVLEGMQQKFQQFP
jgi:hypothetical protein